MGWSRGHSSQGSLLERPAALFALLSWQIREYGGQLKAGPSAAVKIDSDDGPVRTPVIVFKPRGWANCPLCRKPIDLAKTDSWDLDHIDPHSDGGANGTHNLRVTHRKCNRRRGDMPVDLDQVSLPSFLL